MVGAPQAIVVMGVSGSGKTTIGVALARRLGWDFEEGDSLHPASNVAKMASGHPLTDEDRWPWLRRIGDWLDREQRSGRSGVVSCSALKRGYRDLLRDGRPQLRFLHLSGTPDLIGSRIQYRRGHFMPAGLLDSQLASLEPLGAGEPAVTVAIGGSPAQIVTAALAALGLEGSSAPGR